MPDPDAKHHKPAKIAPAALVSMVPCAGQILLITGPSGAGKSSLLRGLTEFIQKSESKHLIDLNTIALPDRPVVDCFDGFSLTRILKLLSRFGLAEAWTYLRTPAELSEGQRWRLRLAKTISDSEQNGSKTNVLICDEFAAVLDRVTAAVVARALRRAIGPNSNLCAIVATSHDDLLAALQPDLIVRCDFGALEIERRNS